jgi:thioredoxin reductase (NADPH)
VSTNELEVVVAGGGIAGLTAGWWAARLGRKTLVLTGGAPGGLLLSIEAIEGLPGFPDGVPGYELCPLLQEQAASTGADFAMLEAEDVEAEGDRWRVSTSGGSHLARTVIVATGSRLRELGVPGEDRLQGRGVSHCASCDAPLLRDRVVAVVGGGDSALQEALTLAESVTEVIVLHRGAALSAQATYQRRALEHPRIRFRPGTIVEEILGDETVSGVRTRNLATGEAADLELAAVFVYVGLEPNTEPLDGCLRLDTGRRIPTDAWMRTELTGLLAAGTVRSESDGQAASSAGDGVTAAIAADRYLSDGRWPERETAALAGMEGD